MMAMKHSSPSLVDQDTDSGIMRGLKELMDLEIELNPTLDSDSSKESQLHWQKQYVEYNFKVKQLLGKLLRKLEDNNEYQRYLEDEIKLLECGVPSSIVSDTGNTPPSVINRPSQEFSSIILGAADFISSKARNICPASLSEDMTSEKTESTDVGGYRNSPFQTEETDDDNGSIKYHFSRRQSPENLNKKDAVVTRELEDLRKENTDLKAENARMKMAREAELGLIVQAAAAMSRRVELLNSRLGE